MATEVGMEIEKYEEWTALAAALRAAETVVERRELLESRTDVESALGDSSALRTFMQGLNDDCAVALLSILAIGQGPIVFRMPVGLQAPFEALRTLLDELLVVERAYAPIGGIVGYHVTVIRLLLESQGRLPADDSEIHYAQPPLTDLTVSTAERAALSEHGLHQLPNMGEIYVVGGAGDRLDLRDPDSGEALPAGCLPFGGRSLIEGLLRDLQGREELYREVTGTELLTPVALMTSQEKDNHNKITKILEEADYFGRPKESFFLFEQPLVPMINIEGNWAMSGTLRMVMKPGGHGVMWTLARSAGVFDWFRQHGRQKVLVRQVNNPVANTDGHLLAFAGAACRQKAAFGFASCARLVNNAEGMNVLVERSTAEGARFSVTNIEYTNFAQAGIEDVPREPGTDISVFPANTNILFADLDQIEAHVERCPLPGLMINMKKEAPCIGPYGEHRQVKAGRLETMMQNLADELESSDREQLSTIATYNHRTETMSVTKNSYHAERGIRETPVGCLYDQLSNAETLLTEHCAIETPALGSSQEYLTRGPGFLFSYHPALGPTYDVIARKLRGGRLARHAELQLEIADVDIQNLDLSGSLLVQSETVCGPKRGRCIMKNSTVSNSGINWERCRLDDLWRSAPPRREQLKIIIEEGATLIVEDVTIEGSAQLRVPAGQTQRLVIDNEGKPKLEKA